MYEDNKVEDERVYENRGLWRNPLLLFKISKNLKKISHQPPRDSWAMHIGEEVDVGILV
jgi:hypothetical protein